MKTSLITALVALTVLLAASFLNSCAPGDAAAINLTLSSPWGDVNRSQGHTTVTLRPIVIQEK